MISSAQRERIPVVDVFAGAGGLGEGFAAFRARGNQYFRIALSVEMNTAAVQTLRLRAFFRMFAPDEVPEEYYRFIAGVSRDQKIEDYIGGTGRVPNSAWDAAAGEEVFAAQIGEDAQSLRNLHARIHAATAGTPHWVLIGGPPCQPFSTAGRTRRRAIPGFDPETDARNFLYREYLGIIAAHWPSVFVMENVRGITSFRIGGELIFRQILRDLKDPSAALGGAGSDGRRHQYVIRPVVVSGAADSDDGDFGRFVIEAERYGIPQKRHRVILLGIRDDLFAEPPTLAPCTGGLVSAGAVLAGLPALRAGISRTPRSREQWAQFKHRGRAALMAATHRPEDVTDSAAQWKSVMQAAMDQPWFAELTASDQCPVRERICQVLAGLEMPSRGRGREALAPAGPPDWAADWYIDSRLAGVCQHSSREHMPLDIHRYLFAAAFAAEHERSPRIKDFPPALRPEHRNVGAALGHEMFSDRFRVQLPGSPATTVMSHLAKDGHYFIHPDPAQARSLTVREAARLQTFPDNYFFCGNRSEQYTQVGNAVPPLLARQLAGIVAQVLNHVRD